MAHFSRSVDTFPADSIQPFGKLETRLARALIDRAELSGQFREFLGTRQHRPTTERQSRRGRLVEVLVATV